MLGLMGSIPEGMIDDLWTLQALNLYVMARDGLGSIRPWRAGGIVDMPAKEYLCIEAIHKAYCQAKAISQGGGK